jgi:hypothetical protein
MCVTIFKEIKSILSSWLKNLLNICYILVHRWKERKLWGHFSSIIQSRCWFHTQYTYHSETNAGFIRDENKRIPDCCTRIIKPVVCVLITLQCADSRGGAALFNASTRFWYCGFESPLFTDVHVCCWFFYPSHLITSITLNRQAGRQTDRHTRQHL